MMAVWRIIIMKLVMKEVTTKRLGLVGVTKTLKKALEFFSNITRVLDNRSATNIITSTSKKGNANVIWELSAAIGSILTLTGLTMVSALVMLMLSRFCLVLDNAFFKLSKFVWLAAMAFLAESIFSWVSLLSSWLLFMSSNPCVLMFANVVLISEVFSFSSSALIFLISSFIESVLALAF